jgi:hypothetical protein
VIRGNPRPDILPQKKERQTLLPVYMSAVLLVQALEIEP